MNPKELGRNQYILEIPPRWSIIQKENVKKAIKALESAKVEQQISGKLAGDNDCFCAIGMMLHSIGYETKKDPKFGTCMDIGNYSLAFEQRFGFWSFIRTRHGVVPLVDVNDSWGWSFKEIARAIKAMLNEETLFEHDPYAHVTFKHNGPTKITDRETVDAIEAMAGGAS